MILLIKLIRAAFLMAREVIPYMKQNEGGHIINFSPPPF